MCFYFVFTKEVKFAFVRSCVRMTYMLEFAIDILFMWMSKKKCLEDVKFYRLHIRSIGIYLVCSERMYAESFKYFFVIL